MVAESHGFSFQNRAARVRVGKGNKPVTYEEAHAPHYIAHRKGWLSLHTGEGTVRDRDVLCRDCHIKHELNTCQRF